MFTENVRKPAVAGRFYDASGEVLHAQMNKWFYGEAPELSNVRALIVPHAGYQFSGETASKAYHCIVGQTDKISKVIFVGPSHRFYFHGCALPEASHFATPLGQADINRRLQDILSRFDQVVESDDIHEEEHSLEVQLPFIQHLLPDAEIIPLLTGDISPVQLSAILDSVWDNETLLVISSDLSHFHPYEEAKQIDSETCQLIEQFKAQLTPEQACGATGINSLLLLAEKRGLHMHKLEQINSGDRHADKERVVGYVSYAITES